MRLRLLPTHRGKFTEHYVDGSLLIENKNSGARLYLWRSYLQCVKKHFRGLFVYIFQFANV